jgi:hypothetical protein
MHNSLQGHMMSAHQSHQVQQTQQFMSSVQQTQQHQSMEQDTMSELPLDILEQSEYKTF